MPTTLRNVRPNWLAPLNPQALAIAATGSRVSANILCALSMRLSVTYWTGVFPECRLECAAEVESGKPAEVCEFVQADVACKISLYIARQKTALAVGQLPRTACNLADVFLNCDPQHLQSRSQAKGLGIDLGSGSFTVCHEGAKFSHRRTQMLILEVDHRSWFCAVEPGLYFFLHGGRVEADDGKGVHAIRWFRPALDRLASRNEGHLVAQVSADDRTPSCNFHLAFVEDQVMKGQIVAVAVPCELIVDRQLER